MISIQLKQNRIRHCIIFYGMQLGWTQSIVLNTSYSLTGIFNTPASAYSISMSLNSSIITIYHIVQILTVCVKNSGFRTRRCERSMTCLPLRYVCCLYLISIQKGSDLFSSIVLQGRRHTLQCIAHCLLSLTSAYYATICAAVFPSRSLALNSLAINIFRSSLKPLHPSKYHFPVRSLMKSSTISSILTQYAR